MFLAASFAINDQAFTRRNAVIALKYLFSYLKQEFDYLSASFNQFFNFV